MHINLFGISGGKDSSALMLWALFRSDYPKDSLRFTFCDTKNEHEFTYDHVRLLEDVSIKNGGPKIEWLASDLGFYELALKKKRFPSTRARFCTEHLKIFPTIDWVNAQITEGHSILAHSGVRANESVDRSKLPQRDLNGNLLIEEYRPLLFWTIKDVIQIHQEHGVPMNKLYAAGARRVGCFPCVMSNKAEMRNIAINFTDRIDAIRDAENLFLETHGHHGTFYPPKIPMRFRTIEVTTKKGKKVKVCSIDDVVKWSMTGKRARGSYFETTLFEGDPINPIISCDSGFCE